MDKEKIIQTAINNDGVIVVLTNKGRLFVRISKVSGDKWEEIDVSKILNK